MVRINLIKPKYLSDQHLLAEYNEILMFFGYVRKHPAADMIPVRYCLGKGHQRFFKDKLLYLKKRHESIKDEMARRGFRTAKSVDISGFPDVMLNDWKPCESDYMVIKERLAQKLKMKPDHYTFYGEKKDADFFVELLDGS